MSQIVVIRPTCSCVYQLLLKITMMMMMNDDRPNDMIINGSSVEKDASLNYAY